jgi:hypothetical protein
MFFDVVSGWTSASFWVQFGCHFWCFSNAFLKVKAEAENGCWKSWISCKNHGIFAVPTLRNHWYLQWNMRFYIFQKVTGEASKYSKNN